MELEYIDPKLPDPALCFQLPKDVNDVEYLFAKTLDLTKSYRPLPLFEKMWSSLLQLTQELSVGDHDIVVWKNILFKPIVVFKSIKKSHRLKSNWGNGGAPIEEADEVTLATIGWWNRKTQSRQLENHEMLLEGIDFLEMTKSIHSMRPRIERQAILSWLVVRTRNSWWTYDFLLDKKNPSLNLVCRYKAHDLS